MINFNDPHLIAKYGSWVKVQVAFYDYLFMQGTKINVDKWRRAALLTAAYNFTEGDELYEQSIKAIEGRFPDPYEAWANFVYAALFHPG